MTYYPVTTLVVGGVLLALASLSAAKARPEFPCVCGGGSTKYVEERTLGYIGMYSFDGNRLVCITDKQETLMAQSSTTDDDPCKFKLTISSKGNAKLKDGNGGLFIYMAEFGFGVHTGDAAKYSKNVRLGQSKVFTRGQGFDSGQRPVTLPLVYSTPDGANHIDVRETESNVTHIYIVMTSNTCPYRLEYHAARNKDNRDGFVLAIGDHYKPTGSGRQTVNHVNGLCGTCDGIQGNDRRPNGASSSLNLSVESMRKISSSYKKVKPPKRKPKSGRSLF